MSQYKISSGPNGYSRLSVVDWLKSKLLNTGLLIALDFMSMCWPLSDAVGIAANIKLESIKLSRNTFIEESLRCLLYSLLDIYRGGLQQNADTSELFSTSFFHTELSLPPFSGEFSVDPYDMRLALLFCAFSGLFGWDPEDEWLALSPCTFSGVFLVDPWLSLLVDLKVIAVINEWAC